MASEIDSLNDTLKRRIDSMDHFHLCYHWRFAPIGDPLLHGTVGDYFKARLDEMGGFTPEINKRLG